MSSHTTLTGRDNYFEDFEVGAVYKHARGKTITNLENVLITNLVMNTAQGHFNEHLMASNPIGHRITFGGEDTERFHTIGGRFVVAAAVPLGLGISLELFVALVRATGSPALGILGAGVTAALFAGLWFVQPLLLSRQNIRRVG